MYCGSCIRDNALAAELIAEGHNVLLVPIYTPTLTDEANVSQHRVFFGGISVYLEQYVPFFRKTPRWLDRLWDAPLVLKALTGLSISNDPKMLGELTVSMLRGEDGNQNKELQKLLDWLAAQPRPDLVSLHNTMLIRLAEPIRRALGCKVVCTMQGEDFFLDNLQEPYRAQALELIRSHTGAVDAFISVSEFYATHMARYLNIPAEKIHVVPIGINLKGYAPQERYAVGASLQPGFSIGYFARITPEKGLHVLCEAYRILREERGLPASRLEAAGYLGPEYRGYLRGVEQQMKKWGLGREFQYRGVLSREEKIRYLQSLDVLSVPSTYDEPKGLYLLEAMACGVPVVQPARGAFPEIVERTGGGILVEPGAEALAKGIHTLWQNRVLAEELGRTGAAGVREHYSAPRMAARALEVYEGVVHGARTAHAVS